MTKQITIKQIEERITKMTLEEFAKDETRQSLANIAQLIRDLNLILTARKRI